jgi:hypothetical protein
MAKQDQDLFEGLRSAGVRKRVARTLADASAKATGHRKAPKPARRALAELRGVAGDLEDRISGGPQKRRAAAKKASATRKRNAAKRSAASEKGARTRAKAKR